MKHRHVTANNFFSKNPTFFIHTILKVLQYVQKFLTFYSSFKGLGSTIFDKDCETIFGEKIGAHTILNINNPLINFSKEQKSVIHYRRNPLESILIFKDEKVEITALGIRRADTPLSA
jgi:hypothetical protein